MMSKEEKEKKETVLRHSIAAWSQLTSSHSLLHCLLPRSNFLLADIAAVTVAVAEVTVVMAVIVLVVVVVVVVVRVVVSSVVVAVG